MIILAAMAVIAATTAIWSIAKFAKPQVVGDVQATDTPAQISPHESLRRDPWAVRERASRRGRSES